MAENSAQPAPAIVPAPSRYDRIKARVHTILEGTPRQDPTALIVQAFLAFIILANTLTVVLITLPDLPVPARNLLYIIITICLFIFAIEYILRIWSCTHALSFRGRVMDRLRYATQIYMVIDLISIIPIFFPFVFPRDNALLHVIRLLSIFKLVRYARNSEALKLLHRVISKKQEIISILVLFLVFEILFSSTIMYLVENAAQPEKFSSIPAAMWWAVMTVTTVGYGDIIPITPLGQTIAGLVTIGGVLLLALPSAILAAGFMEERQREQASLELSDTESWIAMLERLGALNERGLILKEEFEAYKALILPRLHERERNRGK